MLKVLIVDDEPVHIQGLIRHVPWDSLGFAAPQVAESGEEALQILAASDIDVLLTDVSMPEMTGIELLAKCKAEYSHLHQMQTIIISGYNDFEFVKDAIHVGAQAYILKPIRIDEIVGKLEMVRDTIAKVKQIEEDTDRLKEKVSGSLELVRERFVNELIGDLPCDEEMIRSWRQLLELPPPGSGIRVIVLGYDDLLAAGHDVRQRIVQTEGLVKAVQIGTEEIDQVYAAKTGRDEVTILQLNAAPHAQVQLDKQLAFIQYTMQEQHRATVTIGVSSTCRSWEEIRTAYKEVKFIMARARLVRVGQLVYYDQFDRQAYQEQLMSVEYIPAIVKLSETGTIQELVAYVHQVFDLLMAQEQSSFTYIQAFGMGVLSELARRQRGQTTLAGEQNLRMWQRLIDCQRPEEIKEAVAAYLTQFMEQEQQARGGQQHQLIQKVAAYLEEHIQHNVTVKELAELYHLNASYLSVLFKREMGQTISDYVQDLRMKKAKSLLSDPHIKVYEVAEQVGFQTSSYFTYLFKKHAGVTPQQYRDYHAGQ